MMPLNLRRLRQGFAISILPPTDSSGCCPRRKIVGFETEVLLPRPTEALWEKTDPVGSPWPLAGRLPAFAVFWLVFFLVRSLGC